MKHRNVFSVCMGAVLSLFGCKAAKSSTQGRLKWALYTNCHQKHRTHIMISKQESLSKGQKKMINWEKAIQKNKKSVVSFATHQTSSKDFQHDFVGVPNTAAFAVSHHGSLYARRLARKALRHRGILN